MGIRYFKPDFPFIPIYIQPESGLFDPKCRSSIFYVRRNCTLMEVCQCMSTYIPVSQTTLFFISIRDPRVHPPPPPSPSPDLLYMRIPYSQSIQEIWNQFQNSYGFVTIVYKSLVIRDPPRGCTWFEQ